MKRKEMNAGDRTVTGLRSRGEEEGGKGERNRPRKEWWTERWALARIRVVHNKKYY